MFHCLILDEVEVVLSSSNESVAKFNGNELSVVGVGSTTIKATSIATEKYSEVSVEYILNVVDPNATEFAEYITANLITDFANKYADYSCVSDYGTITINAYKNGDNIQWNTKSSGSGVNSGIIIAANAGYIIKGILINSGTKTYGIYVGEKAFTATSELANLSTDVTVGNDKTYTFGDDVKYLGVRPTATGAVQVTKITILWGKAETPDIEFPSFGEAEHSFTTESSEIRIADADHAFDIFYLHIPAPAVEAYAEGDADNFENKAEFDDANGEHVIPVSESGTLSYYAVHTATGTQGATETVKVTKTATTAIDAIGADAAEGEAEYFDIRGVKVNIDNAAPGLYIRRQGTTATKVIVK